ncbi:MAG: HAMP domain-containing sensor histidine kinase [Actinomyces sp.]|uniref:sensor histidine kinase n=1 Tax=Actinomyces sp. TaxID=29317 RepID=UPI0026DD7C15|nr:HAMP domain-containing sensor histidine kinase [Actinomyces sp.]MDO4243129.1 HAMP domain-containing sensor histidine kinase [Actinomyces sp.]
MAALMGALSTLTLRHTLMNRLDEQLVAASERAANRRHGEDTGTVPSESETCVPSSDSAPCVATEPLEDDKDHPVPAGLDAPGQPTGMLSVIASGAGGTDGSDASTLKAGYIDRAGNYQTLSEAETAALLTLEVTGKPVSVRISSLGDYRILVARDAVSGDIVITGLSMEDDNGLVRTHLIIESSIALLGAVIVALAGRSMIRSSLAPLERVAGTAERVASQPLAHGEVSIDERVPDEDLASSQEVGQVGSALNTLLGHVEAALAARQRSETQVRQFVADASHELRTPLASIRGYTELIAREGADAALPEQATHALERVHSESVRMTALVEDLLLLARLDAGRELRHDEVDMVSVVVDTVADARAAGPDHIWELELPVLDAPEGAEELEDFEPEPPIVEGDEARLRQVLVNLLANARVHTPPGSRVRTTLSRRTGTGGEELVVTVADNGPGIDPAVRDRLFERFARADSSRERRTGSTGLGMSIALAIVQSHGGTLTVDSRRAEDSVEGSVEGSADAVAAGATSPATGDTATGHGTTFTVALPALPGPAAS